MVTVKYSDLLDAVEFVSAQHFDTSAYVCTETGFIYFVSSEIEEEVPGDLATSDKYLAVPDKRDLDLGSRLALAFVAKELSDDFDAVASFFRKKGELSP